jgi:hypothetical protein
MARWWIAAARLALLAGALVRASSAAAQEPRVAVKRVGVARLTIEPGTQTTVPFQLSNRSALAQVVQGRLALPTGWRLVIPEPPVALSAHDAELRLLRIALPGSARAGVYTLSYSIAGTNARDSVLVVVPERHRIVTSVRDAPRFVSAGTTYDLRFAVRNSGNAPATVRLALSRSDDLPMQLDSTIVHIETGGERVVGARVQSGDRVTRKQSQRIRLIATLAGDTTHIEPAVSLVEVIPLRAEGASRFRSLPSQLTVRQVDRSERPTVELRGGGALTSSGATTAEFLLRGPNQTASLTGDLDEYRLSLSAPHYRLRLGDRTAAYSRLGESWRSGFGGDAELAMGGITLGGFAQYDRRSSGAARDEERGASVGLRAVDQLLTGVRYLAKTGPDAGEVWTAHGLLTPWRAATVDAEYGRGRDSMGTGAAYSVVLSGAFPRGSYGLRRLAADSAFPGLTRGTSSSEAFAEVVPLSRLRLSLGATDYVALRRPALTNRFTERQRAVNGRIAWSDWLEAGYRRSTESRLVLAAPLARRTESMRFALGLPLGIASLRGGFEQGVSVFENASADRVPFRRLSMRASVGRGENQLSVAAEELTGMPTTSWLEDDHVSAAISAGVRITPSTRLSASVNVARYRGDHPRTPMVLDLGVVQDLPVGQASWRTRVMSYGPGVPPIRPTHQADYTVPLGLPVGRSGESGAVEARLVDREVNRPMTGVLVRLGDQAQFTDGDGRVAFTGLREATHYLQVDRATLGTGRITVPGAPLGVPVRAGETARLELGVVRGARVQGTVRRFEPVASSPGTPAVLQDSGPMGGAVMQLSRGSDTLRASVDGWGHFTFGELAPGSWTLSVVQADLPRYHRFEQERSTIELRTGESLAVVLRVIPSAPPVQIIAEQVLTLEPSSGAKAPRAGLPWHPGRRRYVPAPPRRDSATMTFPSMRRSVPPPSEPDSAQRTRPPSRHRYTVTRWDLSLVHVARVMYGDASLWPKIWLANLDQVTDPDVIRAGQRLRVPDKAPLTADEQEAGDRYMAARRHTR